jgi:hypothetical protein
MSNLQDLINLAKADGGKFFVIDEQGNAKLVIMSLEDYERLLLGKLKRQVDKMILKAQLQEEPPAAPSVPKPAASGPQVTYADRPPRVDLRAEVIDPSFDFEGPKVEIDDL